MPFISLCFLTLHFLVIKIVNSSHNFSLNNNFLHLNDVSTHCNSESSDSLPYEEALKKCYQNESCVYVRVEELDVYRETLGNSRLCYSTNMSGLFPLRGGRDSFLVLGNCEGLYSINLNRKGICKPGQIVGQMEPVSSYSEVTAQCQKLNCDFFTLTFYEAKNMDLEKQHKNSTRTTTAQFCVGDPLGLWSEGHLMGERTKNT